MRRFRTPRGALARALVAAALLGSPLPAVAADLCGTVAKDDNPVGSTKCPGVRPGALIRVGDSRCTAGFLFQGSDRRRYLATAGHCAYHPDPPENPGRTDVWRLNAGQVVTDADGKQIGRFAYASVRGKVDFALIRLDPKVVASPEMCHFGGPTGITTDVNVRDTLVRHYGHGSGMYFPARTGEAFWGLYHPDYVAFYGLASTGDSGGPVTDDKGKAVGLVTDLTTPGTGNVGVNRLPANLAAAAKALRIRLTLLTAPVR